MPACAGDWKLTRSQGWLIFDATSTSREIALEPLGLGFADAEWPALDGDPLVRKAHEIVVSCRDMLVATSHAIARPLFALGFLDALRFRPSMPTSAEPNSQAAAGRGTAETVCSTSPKEGFLRSMPPG